MSRLKRYQDMGAEIAPIPKRVTLDGLPEVVEQLRMMAESQQRSQQILIESINGIVDAIQNKDLKSTDIAPLVAAVRSLKQDVVTKSNTDYQMSGKRDERTGLIDLNSVKFTAIQ